MTTAIALLAAVPMQLAAAAGLELAGGYDSTVLNQQTLEFGDGVISRGALDFQLGHRTETFRQLLRARGEMYYTSGEGFDISGANLVGVARYALRWDSDDDLWHLEGEASYVIGRSPLLLNRGRSPDLVFQRGLYGEVNAHLDLTRQFGERTRLTASGLALNRHAVDIPENAARNNLMSVAGVLSLANDITENNTLEFAGRGEGFNIDGVDGWLARVTGYAGIRRRWSENFVTFLLGGVDTLQDQNNRSEFLVGPYGRAGFGWAQPEDGIALSFDARYEYAIVASTRCNVAVRPGQPCPPGEVAAGGVGRMTGAALNALYRPVDSPVVFTASVQGDYGVTQNFDPSPTARPNTLRDVENVNFNAGIGARWVVNRHFGVFTRYDFFWSHLTVDVPGAIGDIVRHVAMAGVTLSTQVGDGPTEPLVAFEELDAFAGVRAAGSARAEEGASRQRDPNDDDESAGGDPMGASRLSESEVNAQIQQQFDAQRAPRTPNQEARPRGAPPRSGPAQPSNPVDVYRRPSDARPNAPPSDDQGGANDGDDQHQEAPR